jgi:DNA-directed RNA polymerase subunit RPC12/RpoP
VVGVLQSPWLHSVDKTVWICFECNAEIRQVANGMSCVVQWWMRVVGGRSRWELVAWEPGNRCPACATKGRV